MTLTAAWKKLEDASVHAFRPAKTPEEYEALHAFANHITDEIAEAGDDPDTSPLGPLFDIVATLMHAYELEHEPPIEASTPGETLAFLLEQHDLTQTTLAREIGVDQGLLSKVMAGRRATSKELAKKLGQRFNVSPAMFL